MAYPFLDYIQIIDLDDLEGKYALLWLNGKR